MAARRTVWRELKVAVSRVKAATAEKNTSNFPNPSRLPTRVRKYWRTTKETRKLDAARKKRALRGSAGGGRGRARVALKFAGSTTKTTPRKVERERKSETVGREREDASGRDMGL